MASSPPSTALAVLIHPLRLLLSTLVYPECAVVAATMAMFIPLQLYCYGRSWRLAPILAKVNNTLYAIFSFCLLCVCLDQWLPDLVDCFGMFWNHCWPFPVVSANGEYTSSPLPLFSHPIVANKAFSQSLFWMYLVSKSYEALDILLVQLSPGVPPALHIHFRVHHNTTPFLALALYRLQSRSAAVFILLNLAMHTLIYAYFAGWRSSAMFSLVRFWGHVQLWGGILVSAFALWERVYGEAWRVVVSSSEATGMELLSLCLYCTYLFLYRKEIRDSQLGEKKKGE